MVSPILSGGRLGLVSGVGAGVTGGVGVGAGAGAGAGVGIGCGVGAAQLTTSVIDNKISKTKTEIANSFFIQTTLSWPN